VRLPSDERIVRTMERRDGCVIDVSPVEFGRIKQLS